MISSPSSLLLCFEHLPATDSPFTNMAASASQGNFIFCKTNCKGARSDPELMHAHLMTLLHDIQNNYSRVIE